jgi:hypothetical protein
MINTVVNETLLYLCRSEVYEIFHFLRIYENVLLHADSWQLDVQHTEVTQITGQVGFVTPRLAETSPKPTSI